MPRLRASPEKTRPSVFWLLAPWLAPMVALVVKVEIEGGEKLPREGAYVLAANHYSEFDPLAVALAVWKLGRAPRKRRQIASVEQMVVGKCGEAGDVRAEIGQRAMKGVGISDPARR